MPKNDDGTTSFDPSQVSAKKGTRRAQTFAEKDSLVAMTAKHNGRCRGCGDRILVGDAILWAKGQGAWHDRDECRPAISTPTDPEAKLPTRNPVRGQDLSKRGENEFDVPIVIRVKAPAYNVAVEEVRLMLKEALGRWPVPMRFSFMGKKKEEQG